CAGPIMVMAIDATHNFTRSQRGQPGKASPTHGEPRIQSLGPEKIFLEWDCLGGGGRACLVDDEVHLIAGAHGAGPAQEGIAAEDTRMRGQLVAEVASDLEYATEIGARKTPRIVRLSVQADFLDHALGRGLIGSVTEHTDKLLVGSQRRSAAEVQR